jgi:hypothetical protein
VNLNRLSLKDKKIFTKYLAQRESELSVYAFANIYIWKDLFDIYWEIFDDNLCIFFKDKIGCFLYLSPLGKNRNPEIIKKIFLVLDNSNKNKDFSHLENIEEKDLSFYQRLGYVTKIKSYDYLCLREDLVGLGGNRLKSKRASYNYFIKHYKSEYLPFSLRYKNECLKLYQVWMEEKKNKIKDLIYQGMLEDSKNCLKILLRDYRHLDIAGRVVKIDKEIKGFTFGFKLNKDTFCILYEITDLSIKGLAQFIFRRFCAELKDFKFINIMDDSGLENLKKTKLSYQPIRLIPSFMVKR